MTDPAKPVGGHLKPCDVRSRDHVPGSVTRTYGMDHSGLKTYRFNSKGYRGEEYDDLRDGMVGPPIEQTRSEAT